MKTTFKSLMLIAAAAVSLTGCKKEAFSSESEGTHFVTFTSEAPTKTTMTDNGTTATFAWEESDLDNFHMFENGVEAKTVSATLESGLVKITAEFGNSTAPYVYTGFMCSNTQDGLPWIPESMSFDFGDYEILVAKPVTSDTPVTELDLRFKRVEAISKVTFSGMESGEKIESVTVKPSNKMTGGYDFVNDSWQEDLKDFTISKVGDLDGGTVASDGTATIGFVSLPIEDTYLEFTVTTNYGNVYSKEFKNVITLQGSKVNAYNVALEKTQEDNYTAYLAGKPIEIAYKTYTKAEFGDAVLLKATSAKFDVRATLLNGGIVFLEEAEGCSFGFSNWVNVTKPLVVISRYSAKPVTLVYESGTYISHNNAQRTVFKNVNFDFSARNNYAFNSNTGTAGDFHFDGCKFITYAGKGLYYSQNDVASGSTSTQRHPASIRIMNCYIELPNATGARTDFLSLGNTNNFQGGDIKEVIYDNNIFYATGSHLNAGIALLAYGNTITENSSTHPNVELNPEITLTNNTFYGVLGSNCYIQTSRPPKVTLKNNIFWASPSATLASYVVKFGLTPVTDPVVDIANNIAYGKGVALFHTSGKFKLASGNNATLVTDNPLAGASPSTGDFTPIAAYASYGAQR